MPILSWTQHKELSASPDGRISEIKSSGNSSMQVTGTVEFGEIEHFMKIREGLLGRTVRFDLRSQGCPAWIHCFLEWGIRFGG